MESAAGPGGSLFVDDEDLDVGLAGGSSDVFSLSAQQSVDSAGEDDEGDHRGPSDGARLTKRRSRFGSHDLLEKYGFGEEDVSSLYNCSSYSAPYLILFTTDRRRCAVHDGKQ